MKKIILLLFGALVGIPAICQMPDTASLAKGVALFFPPPTMDPTYIDRIPMVYQKTVDKHLNTGGSIVYLVETNTGNTARNTFARALITMVAMSADISPADLVTLEKLVAELVKPGTYVPPTGVDPQPKPDIVTDIDNLPGPGVTYTPATNLGINVFNGAGWYHFKSNTAAVPPITWPDPAFNQSFSVLNVAGNVEIDIEGYKFEWHTEKRLNHGIASVSVDGGTPVDVDLYNVTSLNNSQKVYTWVDPAATPTNKPHKIRISFTGRKNTAATEANIIHDYIKVFKKQP